MSTEKGDSTALATQPENAIVKTAQTRKNVKNYCPSKSIRNALVTVR